MMNMIKVCKTDKYETIGGNTMEIIIKLDHDEQVNTKIEKLHPEDELHPMDEELQDLKLENDRLKQREEIMLSFLKSVKCAGMDCRKCLCFDDKYPLGRKCVFNRNDIFVELSTIARELLHELEALG